MPTTNPVPSTDPSDLLFNAGKLDEVVNGTANSFTDRLGVARRTVAGMNADFDAQLADAESDLNVYRADAAASAAEALGYLQTIRATSYGAYAEDPTTDPLGNPPTEGDEYWNTTAKLLKRWNGTTWQASDINTANLAASSGSSLVGYDGGTVQDVLDGAKSLQDYAALRSYSGRATRVYITGTLVTSKPSGITGVFQYDPTDTTSADNGGTIIVGAGGRRWKRDYNGPVMAAWFGVSTLGSDVTTQVHAAINSTPFGELVFPTGVVRISSPIAVVTDANAGLTRRDRRIIGNGTVIHCGGVGQTDGFLFSSPGPWPATSFSLSMEGFTFDGAVTRGFVSFPDADNFFEQMLFERVTTANSGAGTLFYFQNGTESNLGGVTIRKCSGGPNSIRFIQLRGSTTYGQFDDWTIEDCFHLGTGSFLYLDGSLATTTLQYSKIRRCFSAGVGTRGISGANQYITNSEISNFYAEPKQNTWVSIDCELIDCVVENVVNTVADFTGKDIKVHSSGATKDTEFNHCKSYNGTNAPWESGVYADISIAYPTNVSIKGLMERYFNNAVSYQKPYIYPASAESVRLLGSGNDGYGINAVGTRTLYTFTNTGGGVTYDESTDVFEIEVAGQLLGGVTNFSMSLQLHDGTNTETLTTIATSTLNSNARHFKMSAIVRVTGTLLQTIYAEGNINGVVTGKTPRAYVERGLVVRANNPVLRVNVTTLDSQAVEINFVKIVRNRRVGMYSFA